MKDFEYDWVQAAPFRAMLGRLIETTGLSWPVLATEAKLPPRLVQRLLFDSGGRRLARIPRECACRILALDGQERALRGLARQGRR